MKKLITGFLLLLISNVSYAATYTCTGFYDGSAVGESIKVNASKISIAETKAASRLRKSGLKVDYVRCKK